MSEDFDDLYLEDVDFLLRDIDVLGNPGLFWSIIGTVVVLSSLAVMALWKLTHK